MEEKKRQTQVPEYKSVEKQIEEKVLKPVGEEIYNFGKAFYGIVAPLFKIPTTVRKFRNNQTIFSKKANEEFKGKMLIGCLSGVATGMIVDSNLFVNIVYPENKNVFAITLDNPEYLLYGWLATNATNALYELGRLSTSRLEHKALIESKRS